MRDRPSGAELLAEARRVLREELLPELTGVARFKALMIGNALGMAERELAAGEEPVRAMQARLSELLDESGTLDALERRLAGEIRGGARDGDAATYRTLRADVLARLAESNPRALADVEPL